MTSRFFARAAVYRFQKEDRAAAMVEFAIVLPLLLLLAFGIVDFGRFFFDYNNLTNAARDGARFFAVSDVLTGASATTCQNRVRGLLANATRAATATVVCRQVVGSTSPNVRVEVLISNYPFTRIAPSFANLLPAQLPNVRAEFRHEFQ